MVNMVGKNNLKNLGIILIVMLSAKKNLNLFCFLKKYQIIHSAQNSKPPLTPPWEGGESPHPACPPLEGMNVEDLSI